MCGGSEFVEGLLVDATGLSPRVRGKRHAQAAGHAVIGSIPACAGEALTAGAGRSYRAVYPRVCGGSPGDRAAYAAGGGLSPRVRGKRH